MRTIDIPSKVDMKKIAKEVFRNSYWELKKGINTVKRAY